MKILIVDDKEEHQYFLESLLKGCGYEVISAVNGKDALEKLSSDSFNMIISDILMPEMDGFQLLKNIKADNNLENIPFVFYTATYTDDKDKEFGLKLGACEYLEKPIEPEELIKIINGIIRDCESGKLKSKVSAIEKDEEIFKIYNERLVQKLEKKMLDLESEIIERKRAEEMIRKLSRVTEQSPVSVVITDPDGNIEYVNKKFSEVTGYSYKELIGENPRILKSGKHTQEFYEELWDILLSGNNWRGEIENKKKNGELYWESVIISPIVNDEGDIINFVGVKEDITKQKKAVKELRENEERFCVITKKSGDVFYRLSYDTMKYEYIHQNIEKLTGYSSSEFNLSKIIMKVEQEDKKVDETTLLKKRVENPELSYSADYLIRTKNGEEKWITDRSYPWYDESNNIKGTLGILQNITERKRLTGKLKTAIEEAEASDKLKSEFLAQMSHEIRTPINVILSFIDLIKDDIENKNFQDIEDSFNHIHKGGDRIIRTIDMILNMADIQTGSFEPNLVEFDIYNDVLASLKKEFRDSAQSKNLKIEFNKNTENTMLIADEYSVHQIFSNLIDNAIKYTKEGKIDITIYRDSLSQLVVNVSDTGVGISEEFLPKLFTPFSQEEHGYSRKFDGNGLGLALVKKYCDINNASVEVESKKNKGTTFTVVFNNKPLWTASP